MPRRCLPDTRNFRNLAQLDRLRAILLGAGDLELGHPHGSVSDIRVEAARANECQRRHHRYLRTHVRGTSWCLWGKKMLWNAEMRLESMPAMVVTVPSLTAPEAFALVEAGSA